MMLFLTTIWLLLSRISATVEETASLTRCQSQRFILVRPEDHREPRNEVGSQSLAEHQVGFEPGSLRFSETPPLRLAHSFPVKL